MTQNFTESRSVRTKPEYLRFEDSKLPRKTKTRVVDVISVRSDKALGQIRWYSRWRQYVFHPHALTAWNTHCLDQIACEIGRMNKAHRELLRREHAEG